MLIGVVPPRLSPNFGVNLRWETTHSLAITGQTRSVLLSNLRCCSSEDSPVIAGSQSFSADSTRRVRDWKLPSPTKNRIDVAEIDATKTDDAQFPGSISGDQDANDGHYPRRRLGGVAR